MGHSMMFKQFKEWLEACAEYGFSFSDISTTVNEYEFKVDGFVMAYWDRQSNFGAISAELE